MRSLALACFASAFAAGGLTATAQASPPFRLSHVGRWVTDSRGRVVIVHGTNMVYKLPPYYPAAIGFGDDDAAFLARNGFNGVRVGVIWKALEPEPGVYDASYVAQIAATVKTLARHGIASLLDFHQDMYNERFQGEGAPDWAVQDDGLPAVPKLGFPYNYLSMPALQHAFDHFWANSPGPGGVGLQDRFAAAWRHIAARFRGARGVLGYELFNEPFPGTNFPPCATPAGCPAFDATLTAFNRRVDSAIRAVDQRTLVWYEPNVLFDFGDPTHVGSLDDPHAGFSFHDYCFTNEAAGCSTQPTGFKNAAAHIAQTHEASMLTEFGATNSASDLSRMVSLADRNMVGWLEWAYTGFDPTTSGGNAQAIVVDPRKPPRGSNVVMSTLRALVEPYPQTVAGTPRSWSFDPSTRAFKLTYSTDRANGRRRFGRGWVTDIAAPALVYGGRYAVTVSGGAIVSRRGATQLAVAACRGARTITVVVLPAGRSHASCRIAARAIRPRGSH